jgi:hypothetical protein
MSYTLDTPLADLELSVRTGNVLRNHGCRTLRDAAEKLEQLKGHARGFGHKSYRELKEMIQYASRTQGDLLEEANYRQYLMEDRCTTVISLLQDVERTLLRFALKGFATADARRDAAFKLRDAAAYLDQLPLFEGKSES